VEVRILSLGPSFRSSQHAKVVPPFHTRKAMRFESARCDHGRFAVW
jgi:hypothetical protein